MNGEGNVSQKYDNGYEKNKNWCYIGVDER